VGTNIPLLSCEALCKGYRADRPPVLQSISLELNAGDYIAISGDSGVGKSTLLNLLAGLDQPDTGRILLDGCDLATLDDDQMTLLRRQHYGFVFQAFHVLPYLTVLQNVELPLQLLGMASSDRLQRAQQMLAATGLGDMGTRNPRELSGGEIQRVAIARALVHRPRLLLADEPTGNLDPRTAQSVLQLLRQQLTAAGGAGILITHSPAVAASADRRYLLDGRSLRPME